MKLLHISRPLRRLEVFVPGSKSISNRLLMLQKTSGIPFEICNLSESDDTKLLSRLLPLTDNPSYGDPVCLCCENCGTAYRFLCACLACRQGIWILEGDEYMYKRPVKALVDTLMGAGADIVYLRQTGFPPLQIKGKQLYMDRLKINSRQSSQYVSALSLILPSLQQDCRIEFSTNTASLSYIDMTIDLMQQAGFSIFRKENVLVYQNKVRTDAPSSFLVEYDWSAAAVWFVLAAVASHADIFIHGLQKSRLQSDAVIVQWMQTFGVQTLYTEQGVRIVKTEHRQPSCFIVDCKDNPDLVPYLATLCVGLKLEARLKNIGNLLFKETNRIEVLTTELGKIALVSYIGKDIVIEPFAGEFPDTICFSSHNDHRMAMAFSVLAYCIENVYIHNPDCTAKSYPNYWENFLLFS
ncbi:MAG: hypothetical protein LBQ64_03990 [Bacteroidales bacterium]|nr:hypothetical protein [Bacteroidales bacterium]